MIANKRNNKEDKDEVKVEVKDKVKDEVKDETEIEIEEKEEYEYEYEYEYDEKYEEEYDESNDEENEVEVEVEVEGGETETEAETEVETETEEISSNMFIREKHKAFLDKYTKDFCAEEYVFNETLKMAGLFFFISSCKILSHEIKEKQKIIDFILRCQNEDGGFGHNENYDSHIVPTHYAILSLLLLNYSLDNKNKFLKQSESLFDNTNTDVNTDINTDVNTDVSADVNTDVNTSTNSSTNSSTNTSTNNNNITTKSVNTNTEMLKEEYIKMKDGQIKEHTATKGTTKGTTKRTTKGTTKSIKESVFLYISSLKNEDASFKGDSFGEVDSRFIYCAVSCLSILNKINHISKCDSASYILSIYDLNSNGFSWIHGNEPHAASVFCSLNSLFLLGKLYLVDTKQLADWLSHRQTSNGGFNGRAEKLTDTCYSWWILASLIVLKKHTWINKNALQKYILLCQDTTTGGISDNPDCVPDICHTFFGLAALSLLDNLNPPNKRKFHLKKMHPVYAIPEQIVQKRKLPYHNIRFK